MVGAGGGKLGYGSSESASVITMWLGSNPGLGVMSGLSLLLVLVLAASVFFPDPSFFLPPQIWKQLTNSHSLELLLLNPK